MSKDLYENNRNMLEKVNHISKIKISKSLLNEFTIANNLGEGLMKSINFASNIKDAKQAGEILKNRFKLILHSKNTYNEDFFNQDFLNVKFDSFKDNRTEWVDSMEAALNFFKTYNSKLSDFKPIDITFKDGFAAAYNVDIENKLSTKEIVTEEFLNKANNVIETISKDSSNKINVINEFLIELFKFDSVSETRKFIIHIVTEIIVAWILIIMMPQSESINISNSNNNQVINNIIINNDNNQLRSLQLLIRVHYDFKTKQTHQ